MGEDSTSSAEGSSALPVERLRRGGRVGAVAARHAARSAAVAATSRFRGPEQEARARERTILRLADDIATVAVGMRGAAQKLGQIMAVLDLGIADEETRAEFSRRMERVFATAPRWTDSSMQQRISDELGPHVADLTDVAGPVSTASIGQVYRARLRDGRSVAVKVKYPNVDRMVRADLQNLRLLVRAVRRHLPAVNSEAIVDEVARQISTELDFEAECRNQRIFSDRFDGHPVIRIPSPVEELCTGDMLVTEFFDGMTLDDAAALPAPERDRIGEAIYRFYCGEMYRVGHFCADPHPGNILVNPGGTVCFVDFGSCVTLSPDEHALERRALEGLLGGRHREVYDLVREAGFVVNDKAMGPDELTAYIRDVAGWHLESGILTITPQVAAAAVSAALLPQGGHIGTFGAQAIVEAHALGRRNELAVLSLLGRLNATAPWSDIARETLGISGPATPMGEEIALWRRRRPDR
ncbi:ABC1 kinase family protein [Gordonia aurantiaca]|uniref:ABC1 kinase family protein n=1 Tax=Gordonia sp. B21 TaxID=3151852 RepID=UPI0032671658